MGDDMQTLLDAGVVTVASNSGVFKVIGRREDIDNTIILESENGQIITLNIYSKGRLRVFPAVDKNLTYAISSDVLSVSEEKPKKKKAKKK